LSSLINLSSNVSEHGPDRERSKARLKQLFEVLVSTVGFK